MLYMLSKFPKFQFLHFVEKRQLNFLNPFYDLFLRKFSSLHSR